LIVTARKKVSILFTGVRTQDMSPRRLCRLEAFRADFSDVLVCLTNHHPLGAKRSRRSATSADKTKLLFRVLKQMQETKDLHRLLLRRGQGSHSAPLPRNVVLELSNDEFVLGDNVFDQIPGGNDADKLALSMTGK
jgi:hypothetical protein